MLTPMVPDEAPTLLGMLEWSLQPLPLLPIAAAVAASLYLWGVRSYRRRWQKTWPVARTASFLVGCVVLAAVTGLKVESYSWYLFSAFMFQHLTLSMLVPPLLIGGAPGVLLLRVMPHHGLGKHILALALSGLRSKVTPFLLHSGFTIPLFLASYYAVYLAGVVDVLGNTWIGHTSLELFFLGAGILFILPVMSIGPLPGRSSWLMRFFDIFIEMPLHVFMGVILMMASTPLVARFVDPTTAWGIDPIDDQGIAGALAWSYGEPVALVTTVLFAIHWRRAELRSNAEQRSQREQNENLEAYNAFLADLNSQRPR